ncbi:shikimate kinase [Bacillus sp. MUM 13]|uniref:shikimate kinase n=1 Tax=Bacillus sp. MUM 13 TaxID=1678001 RepID=UPI0008F57621|nr:shikimate kinase [Bacillus sp. MUM 13]OIK11809.1 shikimate kinase [Bacillus sp. MUM 13]
MKQNIIPAGVKNIVLIGFMGAGKTTAGKKLAEMLHRHFIDIDEEIEKEFQMPASEIFCKFGEKTFREKEKEMIRRFSQKEMYIISVGGGAFLQKEIREMCLAHCTVIFIEMSWDFWKERIPLIIGTRPVLQDKTMEQIRELFIARQEIYIHHHLKISADTLNPEETAAAIAKIID